jgi:hypothetical protein
VIQKTPQQPPGPYTSTTTQLSMYERSIRDWLRGSPRLKDGKPIPVVMASPERAFSQMMEELDFPPDKLDVKNVPLPFMSIYRRQITRDENRFRGTSTVLRNRALSRDLKSSYNVVHPRPIDIEYQVEIWARSREVQNAYVIWMISQFESHEAWITVDFNQVWEHWGRKIVPLWYVQLLDNSKIESGESLRTIRSTLICTLKGWFLPDPYVVPTVLTVEQDLNIAEAGRSVNATEAEIEADPEGYPLVSKHQITHEDL